MVETEVLDFDNKKETHGADSEETWEEEKSIDKNLELNLSLLDNNEDETDLEEVSACLHEKIFQKTQIIAFNGKHEA